MSAAARDEYGAPGARLIGEVRAMTAESALLLLVIAFLLVNLSAAAREGSRG